MYLADVLEILLPFGRLNDNAAMLTVTSRESYDDIFFSRISSCSLELEELLGIVITDIFYHLINAFHFASGNFTVFHIVAQQVT